MAAQDVDTRTNTEIEADAMNVLIDVLGGDNDSNIAKTLSACQIKDPSLIMSLTDEEIGELKINKNNKLSFANRFESQGDAMDQRKHHMVTL